MIKCQYTVSHAKGNLVSSPRGAAGSDSFRARSDVCICHLETTTGTGGVVQGKTCTTASVQFQVTTLERGERIYSLLHLSNLQKDVHNGMQPGHLSYTHITQYYFFKGK